ncbi:winged helix-turn-helix transcriptional regulator [Patescibacteria group bacterium]|nr:winged helix-turn-helix transcriptional regulator [Patescibacteria group bacterium]
MTYTMILILVLVIGIVLGSIFSARKRNSKLPKTIGQEGFIPEQTERKEENKEKILEFLKHNSKIVNDDVEKLVKVSNATAERYLDELEEENKIKQVGKTGNAVYYELI